ncbi:MAG: tetratricopeptide repeat protein [Mariprofundaceae bacterium]|nr:tetratricopeptide repeat protein [Mariprofundaceae bacterium]
MVYIPLLAGKEQEIKKYVDSLDPPEKVKAEIVHFDTVPDSHPDITGFIKLTGSGIEHDGLIAHSNAIIRNWPGSGPATESASKSAKKGVKKSVKKTPQERGKDQQYMVGLMRQTYGDMENAIRFFKLSADQGYDMAQYSLGDIYFRGSKGVPQDYPEALKWYLLAAKQGNVPAQVAVGTMYARGNGTRQDHVVANRWFLRAANKGNAVAQFNLGMAYDNGLGVKKDHAQAFQWFLKAAENDLAQAQLAVGAMYAEGRGTRQDSTKAYYWTNRAAGQGYPPAITARDEMDMKMTPEELSSIQRESGTTPPK